MTFGTYYVMNDEGKFLSFDLIWFVDPRLTRFYTASKDDAFRRAQEWWKTYGTRRGRRLVGSRRVYVATNGWREEVLPR